VRYYSAIVMDPDDPEQRGRLKLEIPEILGAGRTHPEWIHRRLPAGPGACGLLFLPPVNSIVSVLEDLGRLRWEGAELGDVNSLPAALADNYPARSGFSSPNGQQVLALDDSDGAVFDLAGGLLVGAGDVIDLRGTGVQLRSSEAATLEALILGDTFLGDLVAALAEVNTALLSIGPLVGPFTTTNLTSMLVQIATALGAGAPYLSTYTATE
jgi:hypothetical protein